MTRRNWLLKSEPESYSWDDLVAEGATAWDGVRNYQARNNLREMQRGDWALFYHSGKRREIVGLMEVTRGGYPDPTTDDERWLAVDLRPVSPLVRPVSIAQMRADPRLAELPLLHNTRLSVLPVGDDELAALFALAQTPPPRK